MVKFQHSSLVLLAVGMLLAQEKAEKPVKFSGEVKTGQEFRKPIGHGLIFLLKPDDEDEKPEPDRSSMVWATERG